MKKTKKLLITGLAVSLLTSPIITSKGYAMLDGNQYVSQNATVKSPINNKAVIEITTKWASTQSLVQRGGDYKEGEYKTFQHEGKTYRYLAKGIDTKKELNALLKKSLTSSEAEEFFTASGIIVNKGKLAQLEADGGTLLNWSKATAEHVSSGKGTYEYRLFVPITDTTEIQTFLVEFKKEGKEYKINKVPRLVEDEKALSNSQVVRLTANWASTESYIQRGGDYKKGEYKEFLYEGGSYRYLASDIDTKVEVLNLLSKTLTRKLAKEWFKSSTIIEHNGKLAQPNADGGSLLIWNKAIATHVKTVKNTKFYRVAVPLGDTGIKNVYIVELQNEKNNWKISKVPYLDLDIPGNINPAFQLINHLLINPDVAKEQLVNDSVLDINQFRKGIKKIEFRELKETSRDKTQVEYRVKFYVELEKNYKGPLVRGENQMYFLIQQTDEMEFKIVSVGYKPHH